MSHFIFDELTNIPTILATDRVNRDDQTGVVVGKNPQQDNKPKPCVFCKGSENLTPPASYQDADNWNVRVFPNKYPIIGEHEIIVHSPDHDKDIEDLPHEQNVKIVRAMLARMPNYTSQNKEVLIFNNKGGRAGASIMHPHSQLVAIKGFPGIIEHEKNSALKYFNIHNACYWCDLVSEELKEAKRVVFESKHFVLLVPLASRWSYEMILVPKEHRPNFEYIPEVEINDFAQILKAACYAYTKLFDRPDRNYWVHTQKFDPFHWHMGLIPQLKVLGGLELGAGIWISDRATPEDAAQKLSIPVRECYEREKTSIGNY